MKEQALIYVKEKPKHCMECSFYSDEFTNCSAMLEIYGDDRFPTRSGREYYSEKEAKHFYNCVLKINPIKERFCKCPLKLMSELKGVD